MEYVIHRVNTIEKLKAIPLNCGVEVDLRSMGDRIMMNHDPFKGGVDFEEYLAHYHHGLLVLNIKEAGIEAEVLSRMKKYNIERYFLLDVEFPYIYRASRQGVRSIAIRYSEDECIETVMKYKDKVDWVWVDTNTQLPLDLKTIERIKGMKTCLVCPERWGRPQDISVYAQMLCGLQYFPDAIMTSLDCLREWDKAFKNLSSLGS
jgi:hypothetical protein